jgi:hypothetical protein
MYYTFYLSFNERDYFKLDKFPGNETFRTEVEFPFPVCLMFNLSVIVMKKLLKALAVFVQSYDFSSFAKYGGNLFH